MSDAPESRDLDEHAAAVATAFDGIASQLGATQARRSIGAAFERIAIDVRADTALVVVGLIRFGAPITEVEHAIEAFGLALSSIAAPDRRTAAGIAAAMIGPGARVRDIVDSIARAGEKLRKE